MGRRKIEIKFINDDRNRSVTFIKRKNGLFKKAHELSILTGAKVTVHVEDIKERQFDYISSNLGGEGSHTQFQSDDEDDDANSFDGQEDLQDGQDGDLHESASSVGSTTALGSKRDSGLIRPGDRRSQSSIHLSPNPNIPNSRRSSGHPYPRSPNAAPARPASMDFSMPGYTWPAGGPQRKVSVPPMPSNHPYPQHNLQQQQQHQAQFSPQQTPHGGHSAQFYFHPNQSQPVLSSYDHQQLQQQQLQQQQHHQQPQQLQQQHHQMAQQQQFPAQQGPRYNGNLFQTNGHPATNSQRHVPAYPSNLVPSAVRPHSGTLPSSKENEDLYGEFGGNLGEYLDDDMDQDFDALGTQASTPGNYDFSTNPSLTNLKMTATPAASQSTKIHGLGIPMPLDPYGMPYVPNAEQGSLQYHAAQRNAFYNNMSGAQSTPNLAWLGSNYDNSQRYEE
ncbi:Putative uncharacterized protein [Taphrina deformans PYCC 5710]|uniref:MADS-box domain-containing protein n=1 Tax=Taphrina deformans (strain PYCC 5710 / ATCC 11124 / CBS 356.35 / IMI 108563 / JCM 9778 / NBRC 8474) TaxID=1097556 RepID=R4X936_TAPDE|nr:Putative uncharacterized protein [Taphrina deformans PYCC 5710]|eukprot:CCG82211.1 Putative uncharacterized protein [Taphrina deformans PYCC 5710]